MKRLVQLLRVAEENEAASARRRGECIREGHLTCFVDEEHVDRGGHVRPRPEPRRSANDVDGPSSERTLRTGVVQRYCLREGRILVASTDLADAHANASLLRYTGNLLQQRTDDLVAVGRDANAPPILHQVNDHLRSDRALAGTGRPLDRQVALVDSDNEPARSFIHPLAIPLERLYHREARRTAHEEVARGAVLPGPFDAVLYDVLG